MSDFAAARRNMMESQLRPNQIDQPGVLEAMGALPRELFVPSRLRGIAYVDKDIAIGDDRMLMEPLVLARLIQLANARPTDKALDVGCATGYGSAVLAHLCQSVVGLECDHALASAAERNWRALGIRNARIAEGALSAGHLARAPYDVIVLGGAVEFVPPSLTDQLAEGGRLVAVIRAPGRVGRVTMVTRLGDDLVTRSVYDAATLPLPGFARAKEFVF